MRGERVGALCVNLLGVDPKWSGGPPTGPGVHEPGRTPTRPPLPPPWVSFPRRRALGTPASATGLRGPGARRATFLWWQRRDEIMAVVVDFITGYLLVEAVLLA